ncbi:hypothetical protein BUALT_Bualt02G0117300 [Buddleja alternifolia]|uniref:Uncharacterized protein n=1 Tax=Buddleja alternifolia TaxID=168488 RepID=A0AAV6XZI5_9LAMI|nr:hypothetical protein BUALT_Bualt02G0117300 [Buddleja alternifolia]
MLLHSFFFHVFICLLLSLTFSATYPITKPGCQTQCGDLTIPFPFGIGSNCSMDPSFHIHCNTSTNPPKAYLFNTGFEVTVIYDHNYGSQIRVKYPNLAVSCYDSLGNKTVSSNISIDLSSTQYTVAENNWLIAIGCDDLVTIQGRSDQSSFGGGCLTLCSNSNDSGGYWLCPNNLNGYLPSNGCCRTTIPKGTMILQAYLSDLHGKWRMGKLFPCSYAFIGDMYAFGGDEVYHRGSYPIHDLHNPTAFLSDNPLITSPTLVLDWRIQTENCSQVERNLTAYACQENSECFDFDGGVGGYICRCSTGYRGNPYLTLGCQDIDECVENHPCDWICINYPGAFRCSCPDGYYGDGRHSGSGCSPSARTSTLINISIGVSSGVMLLVSVAICFRLQKVYQKRKMKKCKDKFFKRNGGLLLQQQTNEGTLGKTKLLPARELEKATDNFSESRILGQGGQGTVYKGMLSDGIIVAIKKSKLVDENQLEQFINEVVILSQINHRNVVKLLGCCLETEVPLLVYEFLPNGTLFDLIHNGDSEFLLSWNMKLKIAADIAGALAYLHSATSLPIYHRDIKSTNILLDEKYVVKVSDFGTSRSIALDQTHLTTLVKGTFGYLDPEYLQSSQFTEKSDVYSFGVVLVELLTGQKPISRTEEEKSLVARFLLSMETNRIETILDGRVSEEGRKEEVFNVARLAQGCLNLKGKYRPTMKDVSTELESIRRTTMPSTVEAESQEAKSLMLSDFECTWTTSSSTFNSDVDPLMFETV